MNGQVVFLLTGGIEKQKKEIVDILINDYDLQNIYDMQDPIKQILYNVFDIDYDLLSDESKQNKAFKVPIEATAQKVGQILGTIRKNLPENHFFNPHKIGLQLIKLKYFNSIRHAILEIDNKLIQKYIPDYCILSTYDDFVGDNGFFLVTGIKRDSEIKMARQYFNNVFVINVPTALAKGEELYLSEVERKNIKPNFVLKAKKKIKEEIAEIMEQVKGKIKTSKPKQTAVSKAKVKTPDDMGNAKTSGPEGRFVYESKTEVANEVRWLEKLSDV